MKSWSPAIRPRAIVKKKGVRVRIFTPPLLLFLSFVLLITIGTVCLKSNWATTEPTTWMQAFFTATSAVTVTGLVLVDTGTHFTVAGQCLILALIQLGGIGLMTFALVIALILGFRINLRHQLLAKEALNQTSFGSIVQVAKSTAAFSIVIEFIGFVALAIFWIPEKGWHEGSYYAVFYAISAFNNAGFALSSDSLIPYSGHAGIVLVISSLFIVGGLGYVVVLELLEKRNLRDLSVYSKLILHMTLGLCILAFALFLVFEYDNPYTLGQMEGIGDKLLAAWFQGTVPRTAGFNSLDVSSFTIATSTLFLLLMFIGGAPNSTASGIKITTLAVLLAATRSFLRGRLDVTLYRRTVDNIVIIKALAVTVIGMMVIFLAILVLSVTENASFQNITFEVLSSFGTVGLSRGLTNELSPLGQFVVIVVMLIGRIGPLVLGFMLTVPQKAHVRFAKTEFPVG